MELLIDLLRSRRSIRRYLDRPVENRLVAEVLEAGRWAPSAHNRQPWRIARVASEGSKRALAEAMAARLRRDRMADGDAPEAIEADAARSVARLTSAPVLLVLALSLADMDVYADPQRAAAEHLMAVQSTAMAAQNMLLMASELGLGACWMCAPLFCPEVVSVALDLPTDWQPQAVITLGWPANPGRPATRREIAVVRR